MKKLKILFKETTIWLVVFTLVCWSASIPFTNLISKALAAGGVEVFYTDDGGNTLMREVYLNSPSTPESVLRLTAYETTSGTNTINSVTIRVSPAMNCLPGGGTCSQSPFTTADFAGISTDSTSGISLWYDSNGNGSFDFDETADSLISSTTATMANGWTSQTVTDPYGGMTWTEYETTFSNLSNYISIPTSYNQLNIFIVFLAENNIDASTLHRFSPKIPQNGISVTAASGATITNWPSDSYGQMYPPVTLGTESSGDNMQYGAPIMISEIQIASSTANIEFVELYNSSDQSYDLFPSNGTTGSTVAMPADLKLHIVNSTGDTDTNKDLTITAAQDDDGDDIAAGGFFLIASSDWNTVWNAVYGTADATYDGTTNAMDANGAVYISRSATANTDVIDVVGWGSQSTTKEAIAAISPPDNGSIERKAYPNSTPTGMTTGIDSSRGNGEDTNNNSADFITRIAGAALPQNTTSTVESSAIQAGERSLVINEVLYNTISGNQWIEIYNSSESDINLSNWELQVGTTTVQSYTLPDVNLGASDYYTVNWNKTGTDSATSSYSGVKANMSPYGGDITLINNASAGYDYSSMSFGSGYYFSTGLYDWIVPLTSTKFVIFNNSGGLSAWVGNVSGDTITLSSVTSTSTLSFTKGTAVALSETQIAIVGRGAGSYGAVIIATISGDTITYGEPQIFSSAAVDGKSILSIMALSATKIAIAYSIDWTIAYPDGRAIVGDISGDTVTFGSEYVFGDHSISDRSDSGVGQFSNYHMAAVGLSETSFVVSYMNTSKYGTARAGSVAGTVVTYGDPVVYQTNPSDQIAIEKLTSNSFITSYRKGGVTYNVKTGTVSDNTITFGNLLAVNGGYSIYGTVRALSATQAIVIFMDWDQGRRPKAVSVNIEGTTATLDSAEILNAGAINQEDYITIGVLNSGKFVTASQKGSVYVGEISASIISTIKDYIQYGGSSKYNESNAVSTGVWSTGDFIQKSEYSQSIARRLEGSNVSDYNNNGDWMNLSSPTKGYPNTGGDSTAPNAVTAVTLIDPDNSNYDLNGNDVQITWTPNAVFDSSFDRYAIYLLPDGTTLDQSRHSTIATISGQYMRINEVKQATQQFTGNTNISTDSDGTALSAGNYRAYVVAVDMAGNRSAAAGSVATALASEVGDTDTTSPMIDHMGVGRAPVDTNLTFYARMGDDRTLTTAELAYRTASPDTTWGNATSTCAAPAMAGSTGLYACSVDFDGSWDEDTTFYYYLRAIDSANNDTFVGLLDEWSYPNITEAVAQNNPIGTDFVTADIWNDDSGVADLTGSVFDYSGNPLQDAFIIISGVATTTATTTSSGAFSFDDNSMPEGSQFVWVIKNGYYERMTYEDENGVRLVRDTSNVEFHLDSGFMSTSSGGSSGSNGISWTAPMDGMMMAPADISCSSDCSTVAQTQTPIVVSFFNQMNSSTIDDNDTSNAGSNIYLTSDGVTKISGIKVKYASSSNEARIYSSTALSNNTMYTVVLTSGVQDTNGNAIESNRGNGNYEFSFSTMGSNTSFWGGTGPVGGAGADYTNYGGGGMMMPPYVVGTNPTPGAFSVPLGAVLTIEFSETMDPSSINTTNIKLYKITNQNTWTATQVTDKNVSVSLDNATKKIVTISHDTLDVNADANGWYEIRVMGAVKSQSGIWLGSPSSCGSVAPDTCLANTTHYTSSFQVGSTADTTQPTVTGSYPSNNDGITAGTTAVDVAVSALEVGFNEAMNPSTLSTQSLSLKKGTVSVAGTVSYDNMSNSARYIPTNALTANSTYTLTASSSITDLSNNALNISSGNNIIRFKTGSADTTAPQALYANGDDYSVAVTFSEPMNAAQITDTTNWSTSVLNIENYVTSYGATGAATSTYTATCNTSATLTYDQNTNTVTIKGLGTPDIFANAGWYTNNDYYINLTPNATAGCPGGTAVTGVKDKSGNTIATNTAVVTPIQSSANTYGMLGPGGGPGMMTGGGGPGGTVAASGPSMNMGTMGMFMAGAFPMNAMAGQTSNYMIDIPVVKALQNGMQIVLTFPTGFDVSSVAKDTNSPVNSDMNEWNNGIVTWDTTYGVGGVASTTSKIVTIQLAVSGTVNSSVGNTNDGFMDSLHIDLKGVKNSSIAKDFGTTGYTVDVKTKGANGAILENITTMPFFITQSGTNTLTVVVNCGADTQDDGTMSVYLGSPMTGPMEGETTTFENGIGTSTFSNLANGEYWLFTDPFVTVGDNNYIGKSMPDSLKITGNATKNLTIAAENAGTTATVSVYLIGNFTTDNNNDGDRLDAGDIDSVDIFANSPNNFRVKTVIPITNDGVGGTDSDGNDDNGTADTAELLNSTQVKYTNYLTEGEWNMGIGPAMPKGPMSGPMRMPDWMEPQMVNITVGIETATGVSGAGDAANALPSTLAVASTNYFKTGDVVTFSGAGAVTGNATTTITDINYNANPQTIEVTPGASWTQKPVADTTIITSVRESSNGSNDAKVFFNISSQTTTYIYGFVLDDNNAAIGNAEVYAYQPQGSGGGHATTDTTGKFSLKVGSNGVWTVGAFKPGMPNSKDKSIDVRTNVLNTDGNTTADVYLNGTLISDTSNNNAGTNPLQFKLKRPSYTISGKVLNASSTPVAYAPVWAYQPSSWGHSDAITDSSGNYILYVDAGTWRIEADTPSVGWLQYASDITISASSGSQSNINLRPSTDTIYYSVSGTVSIDGSLQTYMPLRAVKYTDANSDGTPETYGGRDYGASTDSSGQFTISLPSGYYRIDTWAQNYGEVELLYDQFANSQANINVNVATTTANITVASADLQTISIQFTNGTASQTGFLNIDEVTFSGSNPTPTGYHFSTNINGLSATSTIKLKGASAGKYYFLSLDVPGTGFFMPASASRSLLDNTYDCIKVTDAARAVYFSLPNASTGMITVSGTVKDASANAIANAWVWLGNPNSFFHTGTESGSNGTFSLTVPKDATVTYNLGADKPGYMSSAPANISGAANSTGNTITLTANAWTITGYIYADASGGTTNSYDSGEGIANAWVWAQSTNGAMTQAPADTNGYYELGVSNGTWQVYAGADGYTDNAYRTTNSLSVQEKTTVTISNALQQNKNVKLTANANWTMKTKSKPMTPSSGGSVDDTASGGTGVKLTIPPNALGSDSNSGNISIQQTSAVTETTSAKPLGGIGNTINATDNSGNAITNLNDYIDVELVYYKADIVAMSLVDYSKLKNLKLSYWDNTLNNWVDLSTTRKAYYKTAATDTEWTLMPNSATQTGYLDFIDTLIAGTPTYTDYKLVLTGKTNHLTVFGATQPQDALLPSPPTNLAQTSGDGATVILSWTAVSTNTDATTITDLLGYEIYRSTDGSTYTQLNTSDIATNSYTDTTAGTASTPISYYYKVTAADDGGNETALADSTALQICSLKSVSNGTIDASCTLTCDTGYSASGYTCALSSGSPGSIPTTGSTNNTTTDDTTTDDSATPKVIKEVAEVIDTTKQKAQEFAQKIVEIIADATEIVKANINGLLGKLGFKRNLAKEQVSVKKYVKALIKDVAGLPEQSQHALTNFITYGTPTTLKLGEGERAGVVNSYKAAFGKLPTTEAQWSDAIKIGNGRWPSETSAEAESKATKTFKKIYLREPDKTNAYDDAAVTVMAYGLRPADRNLNSEKAAIKIFKAIYKYNPESATDWDAVRAISYSGATR